MTGGLAGMRVLVTRPRERAAGLADLIRGGGGEPILWPAIEIAGPLDFARFDGIAARLGSFGLAVFISPTAVERALGRLQHLGASWPASLPVAAIGTGTRRELEKCGFKDVVAPQGQADSEALLALPALQEVQGRRVVIFRGSEGREVLASALAARGATIEYAECYRRIRPQISALPPAWASKAVRAVTVSSGEGLENVVAALDRWRPEWRRESVLFVPHARVAEDAARLGVQQVVITGASDEEIAAQLVAYFRDAK